MLYETLTSPSSNMMNGNKRGVNQGNIKQLYNDRKRFDRIMEELYQSSCQKIEPEVMRVQTEA